MQDMDGIWKASTQNEFNELVNHALKRLDGTLSQFSTYFQEIWLELYALKTWA
jgi:hypothetical protein